MVSIIKRISRVYRSSGIGGIVVKGLVRFGMYEPEILATRKKVNAFVRNIHDDIVAYGPYSGMILSDNIWWGRLDFAGKILGTYETQVIEKLITLSQPGATFLDIGSADGFFAVGMLRTGSYDKAVCFEISQKGRDVTAENARKNGVHSQIEILGQADAGEIAAMATQGTHTVILCDIEGGEFSLFDDALLASLAGTSIVIEMHPHLVEDGYAKRDALIERAQQHFKTETMKRAPIPLGDFSELEPLNDNERVLTFSEGRGAAGGWLVLTS